MEVAEDIRLSREHCDINGSTEYEAAEASQAQVALRICELRGVLVRARILEPNEIPQCWVDICTKVHKWDLASDEDWAITLASSIEAYPERNLISFHCPLGEALVRKRVGEVGVAATPSGEQQYKVTAIRPGRLIS